MNKRVSEMTRGERVIAFIERFCIVPDGVLVGKPMRLEPFQKRFITEVYDNPDGTTRAILSISRKNGKSGLVAALLLAHLVGPEARQNSQIVSGAMSREQAAIVFRLATKMIGMSDQLRKLTHVIPSAKKILGLARNTEYVALSADGKTAHGLSPVLAILDEVGQVRGPQSDFIDAIVTSQGAHEAPLLIAISTQAATDADLFSVWIDDAIASKDRRVVCHLYSADADCDLMDREQWKKSNPALGVFRSEADMREQAERASRMPSFESTFRNLALNQRVEAVAPFVSPSVWLKNMRDKVPDEPFERGVVYGGLDLSARTDLTAFCLVALQDGKFFVRPYFWTPEDGLKDRARRDKAPYDVWLKKGFIRTTPGASIAYATVAREIAEICSECGDLRAISFDRWRMDIFKAELDEIGISLPLVPFGQGFKDMSPAIERTEELLLNEQFRLPDNPALTMCAQNARAVMDDAGNRKLVKGRANGRIDGIISLIMAVGAVAKTAEKEPERTYQMFVFGD